ncbi:MAG: hypothetical protein K2Q15_04525, partial [Burkholderiales bacterium]|nr:hypothetical protein [Burkholderiales bacterium]
MINGQLYKQIIVSNNLTADILPLPQYIIESFLIINQLSNSPERAQTPLLARFKEAQEAFYQGQETGKPTLCLLNCCRGSLSPFLNLHTPSIKKQIVACYLHFKQAIKL